jgi:hypothetical protein
LLDILLTTVDVGTKGTSRFPFFAQLAILSVGKTYRSVESKMSQQHGDDSAATQGGNIQALVALVEAMRQKKAAIQRNIGALVAQRSNLQGRAGRCPFVSSHSRPSQLLR